MNPFFFVAAVLCSLAAWGSEAGAQETAFPGSRIELPEGLPELPRMALSEPEGQEEAAKDREDQKKNEFSLGPVAGYLRVRDADRGSWFGGVQARYRFLKFLGVEGSFTFRRDRFEDGDIVVTQYPVQVTGLVFPFPRSPIEPYGLVGVGWYYTRVDFDDSLGGGDETDRLFGVHLGAGVQVELTPGFALFGDFRWIFLDEPSTDNSQLEEEEFDSWQVMLGGSFRF
jgi:opacity protein-like surface antigen